MSDCNQTKPPESGGCPRARAEGAFIAFAAGDALGWPQEFPGKVLGGTGSIKPTPELRAWKRRGGGQYYPYEEMIQRGEYSDDTQLTLAVARSRLFAGTTWWHVLTRTELPLWTLYERGGGGATKRAAALWTRGESPWSGGEKEVKQYFEAGGNGVAMRVLPHAIFHSGVDDPIQLVHDVILDGVATHGHPRALIGATAYAYAVWWLLRIRRILEFGELVNVLLEAEHVWGCLPQKESPRKEWFHAANKSNSGNYEALWKTVVDEMRNLLEKVKEGLAAGAIADDDKILRDLGCLGESKGAGTVGTAAAVYLCSRYATQLDHAVVKAAFAQGSDTDTVAAMTGGLAGSLAGTDWMPPDWYSVQDCDYLRKLANAVAQGVRSEIERPKELAEVGKRHIDSVVKKLVQGHKGKLQLDGIREAEVTNIMSPKPLSNTTVAKVWQIRINDGQKIYVTKLGRKTKEIKAFPNQVEIPGTREDAEQTARVAGYKLSVTNLNKMTRFYETVIGLRAIRRSSKFVTFGMLSLVEAGYAAELSGNAIDPCATTGRHRIGVTVANLKEAYTRARKADCVAQEVTVMPWGQKVFHCRDPEGNILEVSESTPVM